MQLMRIWILAALGAGLVGACAAPPSTPPSPTPMRAGRLTRAGTLTPYTPRPTSTPSPLPPAAEPLPSPTPTPLTHTVAQGEDLFGISLRYGVALEELKNANPEVDPNFLSIGTVLIIPGGGRAQPTVTNPTPTPLPLTIGGPDCWPSADGGLTCIVLATNPGTTTLENLAVVVRAGTAGGETLEREAFGLLNLLPPGQSLPMLVFFPAPAEEPADNAQTSAELLRAFPLPDGDSRYTPLDLPDPQIEIAADGLSAVVRGQAVTQTEAQTTWIAAWAVDDQGRLVAARRWEASTGITAGTAQPFSITLYSLGGPIQAVHILGEARR